MKDNSIEGIMSRYRSRGLLVDSNLLLLYIVGKHSIRMINRYKRTSTYSSEDFKQLVVFISKFDSIIATPNILTEVSNLSPRSDYDYFQVFREEITIINEEYIASINASEVSEFARLGLTDAAIIQIAKGTYLVLTDDFPLYYTLKSHGIDTVNFNHIRLARWLN